MATFHCGAHVLRMQNPLCTCATSPLLTCRAHVAEASRVDFYTPPEVPRMSDADVERIARRIAQFMRELKP